MRWLSGLLIAAGAICNPVQANEPPRSILILPPINESPDVRATYGYLSTITRPMAEMGYYIFPVALVDAFFYENGMVDAREMQAVAAEKLREVFGADAALYITLREYGSQYLVLESRTSVRAELRLIDLRDGRLLWQHTVQASEGSSNSGKLGEQMAAAVVGQILDSSLDRAHKLAEQANMEIPRSPQGLDYGPYRYARSAAAQKIDSPGSGR